MILLRDTTCIIDSMIVDTPTGDVTKGDVRLQGTVYGFVFATATLTTTDRDNYSESFTLVTKARQVLFSKVGGTGSATFAQGAAVYVNIATGEAEASSTSGNFLAGYALEAATESDTSFLGNFDGNLGV